MSPERWRRLEELYDAAAQLPAGQRELFLSEQCGSDDTLRRQLYDMLTGDGTVQLFHDIVGRTAAAAVQERDEWTGRRLGPYRIEHTIGHGGMGAVYLAVRDDQAYEKQVAIKIVRLGAESPDALVRFRRERQILAGLEHPYIARLIDGGESPAGPYIVLEFVEGQAITSWCQEAQLGFRERVRLFLRVCEAVEYAHRNLVVHRDLKPSNILVTREGTPKLLDFGIAKLLDTEATHTITGLRALTPEYASPEQVRGTAISTASDVYSAGVVLYEMLAGKKPYRIASATPAELERVICLETPPAPGLGEELDHILLMALRKEPERRYGSMRQFAEDLERWLENRPVLARPDTLRYRAAKYMRRNRFLLTAVSAVMATMAGGVVVSQVEARRAQRRFEDVRGMANSLLFSIDRRLRNLPGTAEAREEIVHTALVYLQALSRDSGNDAALQKEVAAAYNAIGDVQGGNIASSLGHPDDALASYRRARELMERLRAQGKADDQAMGVLTDAYFKSGLVWSNRGHHAAALQEFKKGFELAAGPNSRVQSYRNLYTEYDRIVLSLLDGGDLQEAMRGAELALASAEKWAAADSGDAPRYALIMAHISMGCALKVRGDLAGARLHSQQAMEVAARFEGRAPGSLSSFYLARAYLGATIPSPVAFDILRQLQTAAQPGKSVAIARGGVAADPRNGRWRSLLAISLRAQMAGAGPDVPAERILEWSREAGRIWDSLMAADSIDDNDRLSAALNEIMTAQALRNVKGRGVQEMVSSALRHAEKTVSGGIYPQLVTMEALLTLGGVRLDAGAEESARGDYERARVMAVAHWKTQPGDLRLHTYLASAYEGLGACARQRRDWGAAAEWYRQSRELWKQWPQRGVSSDYDRKRGAEAARLVEECEKRR